MRVCKGVWTMALGSVLIPHIINDSGSALDKVARTLSL